MTTRVDEKINEGSTVGFNITVYDTNSSVIVPSSMDYTWYDSAGSAISSGTPESVSSESLIVLGSSLTLVQSFETRPEVVRVLKVKTTYNSAELGSNAIRNSAFEFTLVNNPGN